MPKKGTTAKWLDKAKRAAFGIFGKQQRVEPISERFAAQTSGSHAGSVPGRRLDSNVIEDEDEYPADLSDLSLLRSAPSKRKGVSFSTGPPQDLLSSVPRIPSILAARAEVIQSVNVQQQQQQHIQLDGYASSRGAARAPASSSPRASPLLSSDRSPRGSIRGQVGPQRKEHSGSGASGQPAVQDEALWVTEPLVDSGQEIKQLADSCAVVDVSFPGDLPTVTPQSLQSALAASGMAVVVARLNMLDLDQEPPALEIQADEDALTIKRRPSRSRSKLQRSTTLNNLKRTHTSTCLNQTPAGEQAAPPAARPARARRASFLTMFNSPVAEETPQLKSHTSSAFHYGPSKSVGEEEPHTARLFAMLAKTTRHLRAAGREPTQHREPAEEATPGSNELYDTDVGDDLKLLQELLKAQADPGPGVPDQGASTLALEYHRRTTMVDQGSRHTGRLAGASFDGLGLWPEEPWCTSQPLAQPRWYTPRPLESLGAQTAAENVPASEEKVHGMAMQASRSSPDLQVLADIGFNPTGQQGNETQTSAARMAGSKDLTPLTMWSGPQPGRTSISSNTSHTLPPALSQATSKLLSHGRSKSLSRNLSRKLSHAWSRTPSTLLASRTSSQTPGSIFPFPSAGWTGYCNFEQDQRYSASGGAFSQTAHSQWFAINPQSSPGNAASPDCLLAEGLLVTSHADLCSKTEDAPRQSESQARRSQSCAGNFSRSQTEVLSGCTSFLEGPATPTRVDSSNPTRTAASRENQTTLWPVFYNAAAAALLRLTSVQACSAVLTSHIYNNPSLMLVLEELFEEGLCGRCRTYTHYLPAQALQLSTAATQAGAHSCVSQADFALPGRRSFTNELPRIGSTNGSTSGWLMLQLMVINLATSENQHDPGLFLLYRPASLAVATGLGHVSMNVLSTKPSMLESVHELAPPRSTGKASGTFSLADELTGPSRRWSIGKGHSAFLDDARSSRPSRNRSVSLRLGADAGLSTIRLSAQLQLMCMALAHVPCMVTILTLDGRILFQNGRSVEYCGLANSPTQISRPLGHPGHPLSRLYKLDMPSLMSMVAAIQAGQYWSGLVRMLPRVDLSSDYQGDLLQSLPTSWPAAVALTKQVPSEPINQAEQAVYTGGTAASLLPLHHEQGRPAASTNHTSALSVLQSALYSSSCGPSQSGTKAGAGTSSPIRSLEHIMSEAYASLEDNGTADSPAAKARPEWFGSASGSKDEHSSSGVQELGSDRPLGKRNCPESVDQVPDLPMHFSRAPASARLPAGRCSMDSALQSYVPPSASQPADSGDAADMMSPGVMRFQRRPAGNGQRGSLDMSSGASSLWAKKMIGAASVSLSGNEHRHSLDERSDTGDLSEPRSGIAGRNSQLIRSVSIVKRERRSHMSGALLSAEQEFSGTARAMKAFSARSQAPTSASGSELSEVSSLRKAELSVTSVYPESQGTESRQQSKDLEGAVSMDSGRMEACVRSRSRFALSSGMEAGTTEGTIQVQSADGGPYLVSAASTQEPLQKQLTAEAVVQGVVQGVTDGKEPPQDQNQSTETSEALPAAENALCWHVIEAHCLPGVSPDQQLLVLVQSDVTQYVNAELEVKKVLDVEHKLLEEIFPRHVLEAMAAQTTSPAKRASSGRLSPHAATLSYATAVDLDVSDTSSKLFRLSQNVDCTQPASDEAMNPTSQPFPGSLQASPHHTVVEGPAVMGAAPTPTKPSRPAVKSPAPRGLPSALARHHPAVTVLFADIKNFTSMCNSISPQIVMTFLNQLFSEFDALVEQHGIYKIETIGDCYMCAGGLLHRDQDGVNVVSTEVDPDHANKVLAFAQDMLRVASGMELPTGTGEAVQLRVGLFGDTINTASRMESTGRPSAIHISEPCWDCLGSSQKRDSRWRPTGGVEAKGKGRLNTYMWDTE